ncbi:low temperature requirement protein A [Actinoplanes lobatus]|uniref:Low temperature requirement protein A n=1 Tax=Actinoplanes lobatus TaxID=113568 RepID=A0A7W7MFZ2_9ACTN|nr:low temperature requirement protein A [Actinoplanes lobatus]MBB4748862.1 low temperature requirement protein LtrA [Actinoplanes lobatus]GGN67743.1 low temperature requirement protein A [Actinoplanes lobatus]GIE37230.1 low temperature requirement protein A [Actinoplanes lobatus]
MEKRVTWAELFFDLVFVFAVTQASHLLHDDHSWAGVGRALIVFVPVYWAWVGTSVHANTHDVDNPVDRIGMFGVGLASLFMALALPHAYDDHGILLGAAYWAARLILAALVFRGWRGIPVNTFSVSAVVTGPLMLAGGLADGWLRVTLWATAAVIDLLTPRLVRRRLALVKFDAHHLPERFGLFQIIALGESVVAVGGVAAGEPLTSPRLFAVAAAFALVCGLWWVYFSYAADGIRHALATTEVQTDVVRAVLAYGHLLFIGGVIAVAVGLAEVVSHPTDHLHLDTAGLLFGGAALYLGTFAYTRWRMFRIVGWGRAAAALSALLLLPLAVLLPAVVALSALVLVLVVLNVTEAVAVSNRTRAQRAP